MSLEYLSFPKDKKKIPNRNDFVDTSYVENKISKNEPIEFLPIDVREPEQTHCYEVELYGITPNGQKNMIILKDIELFFDILVPSEINPDAFMASIQKVYSESTFKPISYKQVEGFPFMRFQKYPSVYIRLYFDNLYNRKNAINVAIDQKYITANNDSDDSSGYYFKKLTREKKFNVCSWNTFTAKKYTRIGQPEHISTKCEYCFEVSIDDLKPMDESEIERREDLKKDKTLVMTWDIETYTFKNQNGQVPKPEDKNYRVFMICMTFHWAYTQNALAKVCLVDNITEKTIDIFYDERSMKDCLKKNPHFSKEEAMEYLSKKNLLIECENERNLLSAFNHVCSNLSPDILIAFNGGNFDLPIIRERMRQHQLLREFKKSFSSKPLVSETDHKGDSEDNVYRNAFRHRTNIKISAEEKDVSIWTVNVPGIIDTDCMIVFKQLYSSAEVGKGQSLNFYLAINKLGGKEDLKYKVMFKYYEEGYRWSSVERLLKKNPEKLQKKENLNDEQFRQFVKEHNDKRERILKNMAIVAKYCVVDAFRCQQLYTVRTVINDKRELCNMAYMPLENGFHNANGGKVRNLIFAYCVTERFNLMFSNMKVKNVKIKFPGAYVFEPLKGVNEEDPVVGLDFSSLYPSLKMAYNISPEMCIEFITEEDKQYAEQLMADGYILEYINFMAEVVDKKAKNNGDQVEVKGWVVRHCGVIEPGDKPNFETKSYKLQRQHALPNEKMGVLPYILKKLFDKRKVMKKQFIALGDLIEKSDKLEKEFEETNGETNNKAKRDYILSKLDSSDFNNTGFTPESYDYDEIVFRYNVVNSKQKALKVYMNTFYGEAGNNKSTIHKLLAAGAVTNRGQYNIKLVASYLEEKGYKVWYGDTDSNYISCPKSVFYGVDRIYNHYSDIIEKLILQHNAGGVRSKHIEKHHRDAISNIFSEHKEKYQANYKSISEQYEKKKITLEELNEVNENNYHEYLENMMKTFTEYISDNSRKNSSDIPYLVKMLKFRFKEEYFIQKVQITRRDIDILRVNVNQFLKDDNGTGYLNMAYEEVLFKLILAGKKKYAGMEHKKNENFYPKRDKLFVKGLDFIKKGQSGMSKAIGYEVLEEALSIENEDDLLTICVNKLKEINERDWDIENFIIKKKYDPTKNNVPVKEFHRRMKKAYADYSNDKVSSFNKELMALYDPPEAGERFEYVMVKKEQDYKPNGNKIDLKNGERMEYLRVFQHFQNTSNPMKIDMKYYVNSYVVGILSRFICYHPMFQKDHPDNIETDSKKKRKKKSDEKNDFKSLDEYSTDKASKYLIELYDEMLGFDKTIVAKTGGKFRSIARNIRKLIYNEDITKNTNDIQKVIYDIGIVLPEYSTDNYYYNLGVKRLSIKETKKNIMQYISSYDSGRTHDEAIINRYRKIVKKNPSEKQSISEYAMRYYSLLTHKKEELIRTLNPTDTIDVLYKREKNIEDYIVRVRKDIKNIEELSNNEELFDLCKFNVEDKEKIKDLYDKVINIISVEKLINQYSKLWLEMSSSE